MKMKWVIGRTCGSFETFDIEVNGGFMNSTLLGRIGKHSEILPLHLRRKDRHALSSSPAPNQEKNSIRVQTRP